MDSSGFEASAANSALHLDRPRASEPDLRAFFAVRADIYLQHFRKLYENQILDESSRRHWAISWHWPAFLVTVPWMFYRKMYSGGIILIVLPIIFEHVLPGALFIGSGIVIALAAGAFGKSWYLDHALNRIKKASRECSSAESRLAYISHAGDVSLAGAIFGLLTQSVTLSVLVAGLLPSAAV